MNNLERQLLVAKQYLVLPNRKRSLAVFHKIHDVVEPLDFATSVKQLIEAIGPVRLHTLRFYVSRPVEVVDYRTLQNHLLAKSFKEYDEPSDAIRSLTLVQRRDELLPVSYTHLTLPTN